jgi:hypothetical protein
LACFPTAYLPPAAVGVHPAAVGVLANSFSNKQSFNHQTNILTSQIRIRLKNKNPGR